MAEHKSMKMLALMLGVNSPVQEAMRLQPVAAQPVRRVAERDFMLSTGHKIPAGTYLEMAQYSMMRNPQWGWEDPEDFKPVAALDLDQSGGSRSISGIFKYPLDQTMLLSRLLFLLLKVTLLAGFVQPRTLF